MNLVEATELQHSYGSKRALDSVSLELAPGVTGLVGVNGAGKSTLMRILAGLEVVQQGRLQILGHDLRHGRVPRAARARTGYMPQDARFEGRLTVRETLTYFGWLQGASKSEVLAALPEWAKLCGIDDQLDLRVESLSGGYQRRVSLCQTL